MEAPKKKKIISFLYVKPLKMMTLPNDVDSDDGNVL